ncbi:MAG: hypothetical protein QM754_17310 [Tepidisphaeraceae bacterium]
MKEKSHALPPSVTAGAPIAHAGRFHVGPERDRGIDGAVAEVLVGILDRVVRFVKTEPFGLFQVIGRKTGIVGLLLDRDVLPIQRRLGRAVAVVVVPLSVERVGVVIDRPFFCHPTPGEHTDELSGVI